MKTKLPLILIPLFVLPACASKSAKSVCVVAAPPARGRIVESDSVRRTEIIKAYPLGRYIDPTSRKVMHEAHTVYRIESGPKWNLAAPGSSLPFRSAASSNHEMTVELNRQRAATNAVIQSGEAVSGKLAELGSALQQNRALAEQNARNQQELKAARDRLETIERQLREQRPTAPSKKDDPW